MTEIEMSRITFNHKNVTGHQLLLMLALTGKATVGTEYFHQQELTFQQHHLGMLNVELLALDG